MSNLTQVTPGTSVTILPPPIVISGVQTQLGAVVGTAPRGPVNIPTLVSGDSFQTTFGVPVPRKFDGGTIVAEAALQSSAPLYFVRVTDGTDAAANATINNAVLTATSTGSGFNGAVVSFAAAGKANAITATVSLTGSPTESFQNISSTNASVFWSALTAAVNSGVGVLRGPSNIISVGSIANATVLPTLPSSATLAGGSDGASGVTANTLVGTDGTTKTGMYTLRNLSVQYAVLADCDSSATWTTQSSFGEANFMLMGEVLPAGLSTLTANAVAMKQSAGLDSYNAILINGDWNIYNDPIYGLRKVSPQGFWLGLRSSLMPHESVGNKPITGITDSERTLSAGPPSTPESDTITAAGIEWISLGIPRSASAWGCITGRNTSSVIGAQSDAYSTMTNFLAATFLKAGGPYIFRPNNTRTQQAVTASFNHFLSGLVTQNILALNSDGSAPYIVTCGTTNNDQTSEALGNLNVSVQVTYQSIIWFFNVSLQGGAAVVTMTSNVSS